MSRSILDALMQLFALITLREEGIDRGREVVASFLRRRLGRDQVQHWLTAFEGYLSDYGGAVESREVAGLKRTALRATKVLRACANINRDLQASEKALVFLRVLEFEKALLLEGEEISERDALSRELTDLVADSFGIREGEQRCYEALVFDTASWPAMTQRYHEAFLIGDQPQLGGVVKPGWTIPLACFRHPESQVVFLRPMGQGAIQLNGELLDAERTQPFTPGSTLRHPGTAPLHFVDIQRSFMEEDNIPEFKLEVREISHWFKYPDQQALHPFSATAQSGMLVGVMGASGSGKSTLLHLLAGSDHPTFGDILLDGQPVGHPDNRSRIGLVPQADHLLPELTVRENLFYAARLAFGTESVEQAEQRVERCLHQLGLWEARALPVGDALRKTISGGQRKRLNIAMELIREPEVLLVDEPTSGLSSKDSEQLMDLLKQMTYGGTLVIAVIHQPSGDIFRSFDALWVMDQGGYPVFTGRPLDALTHFRSIVNHFDAEQVACGQCGHVNPEQIFDIIEVPVLDGRGKSTGQRRISPKEWNDFYNVLVVPGHAPPTSTAYEEVQPAPSPRSSSASASWLRQWRVQALRDITRKWKNPQYLWINLLEAPVLALLLAGLLRSTGSQAYDYGSAINLPHFLFVAVIVAIFMGLTVSAEELFRDRLMRKREDHLQLSWGAYLGAKTAVLFGISAIQTVLFAAVSHPILALPGHFGAYVLTLFTVAACANVFGLIISLLFNSVRVIYLAIPLFIIPQLMLGGAIVPFSDLNPRISRPMHVAWPAQFMISRWGFESLTTLYAAENEYDAALFEVNQELAHSGFLRDRWIPEMRRQVQSASNGDQDAVRVVAKGLKELQTVALDVTLEDGVSAEEATVILQALDAEQTRVRAEWRHAKSRKDDLLQEAGWNDPSTLKALKAAEHNRVLNDWVTGGGVLDAGFSTENHRILNTRDAMYASDGHVFHAAQVSIGQRTLRKRHWNLALVWAGTLFMVLGIGAFGKGVKRRGQPR